MRKRNNNGELHDSELAEMPSHERKFIKKAREMKNHMKERVDVLKEIEKDGRMNSSQEIWLIRLEGTIQTLEDCEYLAWEIS